MIRFIDGFDLYATADLPRRYNYYGGFLISPAAGRFGSGAISHEDSLGQRFFGKFFNSQPTWIIGFSVKFTAIDGKVNICVLQDSGNAQVELGIDVNSHLAVYRNGTLLATGASTIFSGVFYYIEWKVTIATSIAANSCKVRLGGVDEIIIPASSNTDANASGVANRVLFGGAVYPGYHVFGDLVIMDGTGTVNNDFLGDQRVESLRPTGAGSHTDMALTGAATNWQAVSEAVEDGDTSYVSTGTLNQIDTYAIADLSNTPLSVAGVQITILNRKDDAGSRGAAVVLRSGGVDYSGPSFGVADSYLASSAVWEVDPNTSAAWTGTSVNALEAGVKLVS